MHASTERGTLAAIEYLTWWDEGNRSAKQWADLSTSEFEQRMMRLFANYEIPIRNPIDWAQVQDHFT